LERESPHKPMKPGLDEKVEYNDDRHGTQALLAGLNVATGKVLGECRDSRTEEDFVEFITSIREKSPDQKQYKLIVDNLNTHKSESLVRYVAELRGVKGDLGIKGQRGILNSMVSRDPF
jgi:hypothetical protein